jgi:hypothetical protein
LIQAQQTHPHVQFAPGQLSPQLQMFASPAVVAHPQLLIVVSIF